MISASVEMSSQPATIERAPKTEVSFRPCPHCGAPMLLLSVTEALKHPIVIAKTYECFVCKTVEEVVAPLFD
jgi:hypothetical protein